MPGRAWSQRYVTVRYCAGSAGCSAPDRRELWVIAGLIVVTSGLGVVSPPLLKVVFDRALFVSGGPRLGLLFVLLALMVASTVVGPAGRHLAELPDYRGGQRVLRDLRTQLYTHLQGACRCASSPPPGPAISKGWLANDVGGLQSVITDTASTILSNAVTLISTVIALSMLSWQLTVLSLA